MSVWSLSPRIAASSSHSCRKTGTAALDGPVGTNVGDRHVRVPPESHRPIRRFDETVTPLTCTVTSSSRQAPASPSLDFSIWMYLMSPTRSPADTASSIGTL